MGGSRAGKTIKKRYCNRLGTRDSVAQNPRCRGGGPEGSDDCFKAREGAGQ